MGTDQEKTDYRVLRSFSVNNGQRIVEVDTVISLSLDKAAPLLQRGLIEPDDQETISFDVGFLAGMFIVTLKTESGRLIDLAGNPKAVSKVKPGRAVFLPEAGRARKRRRA